MQRAMPQRCLGKSALTEFDTTIPVDHVEHAVVRVHLPVLRLQILVNLVISELAKLVAVGLINRRSCDETDGVTDAALQFATRMAETPSPKRPRERDGGGRGERA